jgi:hypothetical protein
MNDENKNENNQLMNLLPSNVINEINNDEDSSFFENDEGEEIEEVKLFYLF